MQWVEFARTARPGSATSFLRGCVRFFLSSILVLLVFCGCSHTYVITLSSGTKLLSPHKPKLEHGYYVYKDAKGNPVYIPQGRVREIAPASMDKEETSKFKSSSR